MKFSCFIYFGVVVGGCEYGIYLHYHLDWKPLSCYFLSFLFLLPFPSLTFPSSSPSPYILLQLISTSLASLAISYDWDFQTSSTDHCFELYTNIHNRFLDIFM